MATTSTRGDTMRGKLSAQEALTPPKAVKKHLRTMVPATLLNDITTFRFIPEFPKWNNKPDIVITTKRGELMELKNRIVVNSFVYECNLRALELFLHYNTAFKSPNYIVRTIKKVFVIGYQNDDLEMFAKFDEITRFDLNDLDTSGQAKVYLWCYDDVIPMVLTNYYEVNIGETFSNEDTTGADDQILCLLTAKLSEARLNTGRNLKIYEEKRKFRHGISHIITENAKFDMDNVRIDKSNGSFDKISAGSTWRRICNNEWVIGIPLENISNQCIEDVEILLKCDEAEIFNYKTSAYIKDDGAPFFWKKLARNSLHLKENVTFVIVAQLPTFSLSSFVNLKCSIKYLYEGNTYFMAMNDIEIKALDVVNGIMDTLQFRDETFNVDDVLSLLATSIITHLDIHFVTKKDTDLLHLLKVNLGYIYECDKIPESILRHTTSRSHLLHGTAIRIINQSPENKFVNNIAVLTRNENQLLMLVNIMYDLITVRVVIVPSGYSVQSKKQVYAIDLSNNSQEANQVLKTKVHRFGSALYEQMTLVSKYIGKCLEAMSENNINADKNKGETAMSINVEAMGNEAYEQFWNELNEKSALMNELLKEIL